VVELSAVPRGAGRQNQVQGERGRTECEGQVNHTEKRWILGEGTRNDWQKRMEKAHRLKWRRRTH
jgi:hypothetical protein